MAASANWFVPAPHDPIRIMPLAVADDLLRPLDQQTPPAAAHLTYHGGPLLTDVKVFTVYWGAPWGSFPLADTATKLDEFFQFILSSKLMRQLSSDYSHAGQTINAGKWIGRAVVPAPAPDGVVCDAAIRHHLQQELVANRGFPVADRNTLFFLYLPPGTTAVHGGGRSCQAFCGYHDHICAQVFYAVVPYPGCGGCTAHLAVVDALTCISSHELCEAITDPVPGQGWYDDANGEIGDLCAWNTGTLGSFTVQRAWSNPVNRCELPP